MKEINPVVNKQKLDVPSKLAVKPEIMTNKLSPVAVQINLFQRKDGLEVVPFSAYDMEAKTSTEVGRFLIPWHELHGIIDRMEVLEKGKLDVDIGAEPF